jgi:hypothetical protein
MKAMMRIWAPHCGRWLLWSLNLPLGSAVLHQRQYRLLAVNRLIALASEIDPLLPFVPSPAGGKVEMLTGHSTLATDVLEL